MKQVARSQARSSHWLRPAIAGLGLLLVAPSAHAEQFVLLDVTFTFTKADADNSTPSKSHYYVKSDRLNAATPLDWTQPIDYRNGVVHVRTEVMDKPAGGADTRWTLCYIARKGIDAGYGCTGTAPYKEEGVWDNEQAMTEWWQNDHIDWTQGIKQMDLVMKDSKGVFAHTQPDPEKWFPTTLRITMIQVSKGSTYDPSQVPSLPSSNGGAGGGGGMGNAGNAALGGNAAAGSPGERPAPGGANAGGTSAGTGGDAPSTPLAGGGGTGSSTSAGASSTGGLAASPPTPSAARERADAGCSLSGASPSTDLALSALTGLGLTLSAWRRRRSRSFRAD